MGYIHYDFLSGDDFELPDFIEKLVHTHEVARLNGISQAVFPAHLAPEFMLPSRFQHSLGVCHSALNVLGNNPKFPEEYRTILPVAALLHDAGSPPFSHLAEHFLKEAYEVDGEGFLRNVLLNSEAGRIIVDLGLKIEEVVSWAKGESLHSEILHGSMDLDNIDNILRFEQAVGGSCFFDQIRRDLVWNLRTAFVFFNNIWALKFVQGANSAVEWKRLRQDVYGNWVYGYPNLNIATMLYRALELAWVKNEIRPNFFFLDDSHALDQLLYRSNPKTAFLAEQLVRLNRYEKVFAVETEDPPPDAKIIQWCRNWRDRKKISDLVCNNLRLPEEMVCVYTGLGRDQRAVTHDYKFVDDRIPLLKAQKSVYRVIIFMHPDLAIGSEGEKIKQKVNGLVLPLIS